MASIELGLGRHTTSVGGGPDITVTLELFDKLVVPLVPSQCFNSLNVSMSNYGSGDRKVHKLRGRMQRSEPFSRAERPLCE